MRKNALPRVSAEARIDVAHTRKSVERVASEIFDVSTQLEGIGMYLRGAGMRLMTLLPPEQWPQEPTLDRIVDAVLEYYGPIAPLVHRHYDTEAVVAMTETWRRDNAWPVWAGAREANDVGATSASHAGHTTAES